MPPAWSKPLAVAGWWGQLAVIHPQNATCAGFLPSRRCVVVHALWPEAVFLAPAHFHCLTAIVQTGRYCWASRNTLEPETCLSRASCQLARSSAVTSCSTLLASSGKACSQASKRKLSARDVLAVLLSVTSRRYRSTVSAKVWRGYSPRAPDKIAASSATAHACASAFVGRVAIRRPPARSTSARHPFLLFLNTPSPTLCIKKSRTEFDTGSAREKYVVLYRFMPDEVAGH